jgi:A/G-specific adenine glycosylase
MKFSNPLLSWYLQYKRDLPWRNTTNPYLIWMSEIMLQQTKVAQGLPYYERFVEAFPTVFDLANATEETVLKLWQGLGYYSRARNLHQTAKYIAINLQGNFPNSYAEIIKLKGVGEYTAAAIASFAFDEVVPVVDGNVFRVLSRYFGVETDIASAKAKKEFTELAATLIPTNNSAMFNQAIMEFGALQCVPKNPNCHECIFNSSCFALQNGTVAMLPVKSKKTKVTNRFFNYLVFKDLDNKTILNKRTEKGIWHNLYEFPNIETKEEIDIETAVALINSSFNNLSITKVQVFNSETIVHKLSHQKLYITFYKVTVIEPLENSMNFEDINTFPFPIVIHNFIEKYLI